MSYAFSPRRSQVKAHSRTASASKRSERAIEACYRFFFPENFEQMIEARAGIAASHGEPRGMN